SSPSAQRTSSRPRRCAPGARSSTDAARAPWTGPSRGAGGAGRSSTRAASSPSSAGAAAPARTRGRRSPAPVPPGPARYDEEALAPAARGPLVAPRRSASRRGASGVAEDPVQLRAALRAHGLGHATTVGDDDVALGPPLLPALDAVELSGIGLVGHVRSSLFVGDVHSRMRCAGCDAGTDPL